MKTTLLFLFFITLSASVFGQEDLLNMLDTGPKKPEPVKATFKTTRVLNGHSIEQMAAQHLDFRINHRFGLLNSGAEQLWGMDFARIRLGLEYGIADKLMVGIGRNNLGAKAYDGFLKYKLLQQTHTGSVPLSISLVGTAAIDVLKGENRTTFTDRSTYVSQVLLAKKFSESISLQLSPTYIHHNQVLNKDLNHDLFAMAIGGRIKITRRTSFNFEYFYLLNPEKAAEEKLQNNLSLGFDIETGGHVFQLHFTNSLGLIEKDFIAGTTNKWEKGQISYGFNISRTFSFSR
jgi:hypothetical protein